MNSEHQEVSILILTGPVGVGKTAVSDVVSEMLTEREVPNAVIDIDCLRWAYPRPQDDPFNIKLGLVNLSAVWANYRTIGVTHLIIPNVVESADEIRSIEETVPSAVATTVCLTAPIDTIHDRLQRREAEDSLVWHKQRAYELHKKFSAHNLADAKIDTQNKTVAEVASEVLRAWI